MNNSLLAIEEITISNKKLYIDNRIDDREKYISNRFAKWTVKREIIYRSIYRIFDLTALLIRNVENELRR